MGRILAPFVSSLDSFESRGVKAVVDRGGPGGLRRLRGAERLPIETIAMTSGWCRGARFVDVLVQTTIRAPGRGQAQEKGAVIPAVVCPVAGGSGRPDTAVMCR